MRLFATALLALMTAIFIATGQDVANVVNSASATLVFEPHPEGLYVSVTLSALSVATVGGGTGLPTQREALRVGYCPWCFCP